MSGEQQHEFTKHPVDCRACRCCIGKPERCTACRDRGGLRPLATHEHYTQGVEWWSRRARR